MANLPEQRLWARVGPHLRQYGTFDRIETATVSGVPDVDYCIDGVEGKIELKAVKRYPLRDSSMLFPTGTGLRPAQIAWIVKRLMHKGRVFLLIGVEGDVILIRCTLDNIIRLNTMSVTELFAEAQVVGDGPKIWHEMLTALWG